MKKVLDMCPFFGLRYEENGEIFKGGYGLSDDEEKRLEKYFGKYNHKPFSREKGMELAQMALDNTPIPQGWEPK